MSDTEHEHQPAPPVHVVEPVATTEAPVRTSSGGTATPVRSLRRGSVQLPGPSSGATGRAHRSASTVHRPSPAQAPGQRIQRSTARPARPAPESVVPASAGRIRPMSTSVVVVRRSFMSKVASAGRGLMAVAEATGKAVGNAAKAVKSGVQGVAEKIHRSDFNDLNATQYLVSSGGLIEAINRDADTGVYYKTGSVTRGDGDRPTVIPYDPVQPMPDGWLPTVTHINGMMVKPNSGLGSAIKLQQELERAGADGALLAADVPQVLYTYSAHRGFVTDLAECIWGKLYQDDDATDRQTQIMLDAVANQHRTTVSAHSRGTIKTDNAVRNAHAEIAKQHLDAGLTDPGVITQARDAARDAARAAGPGLSLSPAMLEHVYVRLFAQERADRVATEQMDRYIQLIYAGNAVQFPSAAVNLNLVVAGSDPVTITVGKYFRRAKGSKTEMTDVEGGHGFNSNYAGTVADLIIADLKAQTTP